LNNIVTIQSKENFGPLVEAIANFQHREPLQDAAWPSDLIALNFFFG
jgi:hypothetical protein